MNIPVKMLRIKASKRARIDDGDAVTVNQRMWQMDKDGYAVGTFYPGGNHSNGKQRMLRLKMHRVIMNAGRGDIIDHINGDKLDNRKANLRICTNRENQYNSLKTKGRSGIKGVSWLSSRNKWRVSTRVNGRRIFLGSFERLEDARNAYINASKKYHGEFSPFSDQKKVSF